MSGAKIYVGNLSWNTTDDTLRNAFGQYGTVLDSIVMRDRETGRSRGFGFVTYATTEEAQGAINNANGAEIDGRQIKVNLASARGGGAGGPGGFPQQTGYPPQMGGGYGGFPAGGYGSAVPYGGGYGGGFQAPPGNPGGFGANFPQPGYPPAGQFPPNQGGGFGGY